MKNLSLKLRNIFSRYAIMILLGIPNLWIFYAIFTPLTIYPSYFILNLFYDATLYKNIILLNGKFPIQFIDACIAGSAYYLLLVLNLSTPKIKTSKRIKIILVSFASLLVINLIRIILLSTLFVNDSSYFDVTHNLFWFLGNIVFVAAIWFSEVKIFKMKEVPFYSDLKFFFKLRKDSHKSQRSNKNKRSRNKNAKRHR